MTSVATRELSTSTSGRRDLEGVRRSYVQPVPVSSASATDIALFQRKQGCACGGGGPRWRQEAHHPDVHTELAVSKPGDQYEPEAARVSEQVMRMAEAAGRL